MECDRQAIDGHVDHGRVEDGHNRPQQHDTGDDQGLAVKPLGRGRLRRHLGHIGIVADRRVRLSPAIARYGPNADDLRDDCKIGNVPPDNVRVLERASGKVTNLTENLDRWISGFIWSPDSSKLFFTAEDRGRQPIEYLPVTGGGTRMAVSGDNHLDEGEALTRRAFSVEPWARVKA